MSVMWFVGPDGRDQLRTAHTVGTVGIELALAPVIGWLLGGWLDGALSTGPVLSYVGLAAGIVAGFRSLVRVAARTRRALDGDEGVPTDPQRSHD